MLLIWVIGTVIGFSIWLGLNAGGSEEQQATHNKYWYLMIPLWPLGILIFLLWVGVQVWFLILDIFHD